MALAKVPNLSPRLAAADDLEQLVGVEDVDVVENVPFNGSSDSESKYKLKICTDFDENSEYADLAEKVFQNVNAVFDRDELVDEFDIIPAESKANHSPVIHVASEHKLALEAWCVPYLYTHSYKSFLAIRRKQKCSSALLALTTTTTSGRSRYGSFKASNLSESDRIIRGLVLSRILVLLNPDLTVAWNFRRDFVPIVSQAILEIELRLVSLVATRKPKCPEGFAYRRWIVSQAFENHLVIPEVIGEWFSVEVKSIENPILKYFSNYHAWSYRIWLLQKILQDKKIPSDQKRLVLDSEFNFSDGWMNTQVSDYCGHHYRQKLLQFLIAETHSGPGSESLIRRLTKELDENAAQIKIYEGHESLWGHRRAIMKILLEYIFSGCGTSTAIEDQLNNEKKLVGLIFENLTSISNAKECTTLNFNHCKSYVTWTNAQFTSYNWQLPMPMRNLQNPN